MPLILGLIGGYWHFGKRQRDAGVVMLLFFFTGLAIVLYLNQTPLQPRERDYAYAGSFYAFAIWIGLGVMAIWDFLSKKINPKTAALAVSGVGMLAAPVILIAQNWDDHDRSEKTLSRDMALNYLESCAPNAILFSYGDNDTYPLWYLQEVEGIRTDVRVVNLSLLSSDWYMRQMMKKVNDADALPININPEKVKDGVRDVIFYYDYQIPGSVDVQDVLEVMLSDDPQNMMQTQGGDNVNILPTKNLKLKVDKQAVLANNVVPEAYRDSIVDSLVFTYPMNYVSRAELSILSILANNNWKRPIYFTTTTPSQYYLGLDKYLISEGFALRLIPVDTKIANAEEEGSVQDTDSVYDKIMNKYKYGNMGNAKYLDPDSYRYITYYLSSIFGETAQNLLLAGKKKEAHDVVLKAYENLPKKVYQMGEAMSYAPLLNVMYETGESAKAKEIALRNLKYIKENMHYYESNQYIKDLMSERNVRMALVGLQRLKMVADQHKDADVQKVCDELWKKYGYFFGE
ncbi:MFS transporter [Sphingobacterium sp. T2]|uniref:MFS transporter n=1 Tax=Sphingobacterium sp. T2 TaxID=1590596 RepID=UPI001E4E1DA3|nr:MFS transporter [Sphingobacterium sp. T2]